MTGQEYHTHNEDGTFTTTWDDAGGHHWVHGPETADPAHDWAHITATDPVVGEEVTTVSNDPITTDIVKPVKTRNFITARPRAKASIKKAVVTKLREQLKKCKAEQKQCERELRSLTGKKKTTKRKRKSK